MVLYKCYEQLERIQLLLERSNSSIKSFLGHADWSLAFAKAKIYTLRARTFTG